MYITRTVNPSAALAYIRLPCNGTLCMMVHNVRIRSKALVGKNEWISICVVVSVFGYASKMVETTSETVFIFL